MKAAPGSTKHVLRKLLGTLPAVEERESLGASEFLVMGRRFCAVLAEGGIAVRAEEVGFRKYLENLNGSRMLVQYPGERWVKLPPGIGTHPGLLMDLVEPAYYEAIAEGLRRAVRLDRD